MSSFHFAFAVNLYLKIPEKTQHLPFWGQTFQLNKKKKVKKKFKVPNSQERHKFPFSPIAF